MANFSDLTFAMMSFVMWLVSKCGWLVEILQFGIANCAANISPIAIRGPFSLEYCNMDMTQGVAL